MESETPMPTPVSFKEPEPVQEPVKEPIKETPTPLSKLEEKVVESEKPCVPWQKNKGILLALGLLSFFTLLFFILYLTKSTKCKACKECPPCDCPKPQTPSEGSHETPLCPQPPQCPHIECEKCKSFLWQFLKDGVGITEMGDRGYPQEITSDTDTLEKAQKWVADKQALGLSYPLYPCTRNTCGTIYQGTNIFYYSYAPYIRTSYDAMYKTYGMNFV